MKTAIFSISIAALVLAAACSSVKTTPEAITATTKQVERKDYTIDVRRANPLRGRTILLNYSYELSVKGDSAFAHLPYFGVAQRAAMGWNDGGIKFEEPITDYTIRQNRKGDGWDISFKVDATYHSFDIFLSIFTNGSASFTVSSPDRDVISFSGELKE